MLWVCAGFLFPGGVRAGIPEAIAQVSPSAPRVRGVCPADLDLLMSQLLPDLPSYANRTIQRSSQDYVPRFVILAGRPEFHPLPQGPGVNNPPVSSLPGNLEIEGSDSAIAQVFFTTLERHYTATLSVEYQQYHWLFLSQTAEGWRVNQMFSRTAYPEGAIPTPPRDSSDSEMAQAVRLWLRDCRYRG
ncbi:hypothetical protein J0895_04335 [Phormidium pseudopriestleyi FRX01]|uniref:Uncharacterized protein n=1 Tax=Phormidium pseudopriestleyi FRX01 TaxID=1759528 RepID=A0ABS3FML7_9CYAN|nr:hypothetical protein [Phormidium pseudopriestleyi]MBO0348345.1 hypothetical protein [Phormidium pseudopriestleyi FRX01]